MNRLQSVRRTCRGIGAVIIAAAVLVGGGSSVHAQTDVDEQIQALQKALDQIKVGARAGEDVEARLQELQAQITKLQQQMADGEPSEQPPDQDPATETGTDLPVASGQGSSAADALPPPGVQGSPNPLQDNTKYLTGDDLLDQSFPNSFPIPGTEIRMAVGGYVKLDFIQDLDYVGDRYEMALVTIPVEGTPESELGGLTTLHAKQTRFNIDFRSKAKTKKGREYPLQVFVEVDFFDDRQAIALQPRLRHAYGVIGRFLAGQTWSTSADLEAAPGTIDFAAGDALYGDRLAQIRWADRAGKSLSWAVALEENKADVGNPLGLTGENRPSVPNLAARLRWGINRSHLQLSGDVFQLDWQGGDSGPSATAPAWGLVFSNRILLGRKTRDALMSNVSYGHGAAHKIVSFRGTGSDAVITADGKLEIMKAWQAYLGYSRYWSNSFNSTFALAWAEVDNSDLQLGSAIHSAASAHANLVWFPYKRVSTGIEFMWGQRENKDGAKGTARRIQMMAKFKFN